MSRIVAALLFNLVIITATAYAADNVAGKPLLRIGNRDAEISSQTTEWLVKKVQPYAAMSELAFRTYSGQTVKVQKKVSQQRVKGWEQLDESLKQQHWELAGHKRYPLGDESKKAPSQGSLECDLWVNKISVPPQVVVAFRGTDGDDAASGIGAHGQFAAIHTKEFRGDVVKTCQDAGAGAVVTATGYSLGGDFAQHLFYYSQLWPTNRVQQATVFGSSSVSGWNEFGSEKERKEAMSRMNASLAGVINRWRFPEVMAYQYGFGTFRVDESGEILSYLRSLFPALGTEQPYAAMLELDFADPVGGNQHGMAKLAQDLRYYPAAPPIPSEPQEGAAKVTPFNPAGAESDLYRILNQS